MLKVPDRHDLLLLTGGISLFFAVSYNVLAAICAVLGLVLVVKALAGASEAEK